MNKRKAKEGQVKEGVIPQLTSRMAEDFERFLCGGAPCGMQWEASFNGGLPAFIARNTGGRKLGKVLLLVRWYSAAGGYTTRHFNISTDATRGIAARDLDLFMSGVRELARRIGLLEMKIPEYVSGLFPRTGSGTVDWGRCGFKGPVTGSGAGAFIKLGDLSCGLECAFCTRSVKAGAVQPPRLVMMNQLYEAALNLPPAERGVELRIGGDEPGRHPDLLSFISLGRFRGYRKVSLQTSAAEMFGDERFLRELKGCGLSRVLMPLYGVTPEVHDGVVGKPGHFSDTIKAIEAIRSGGLRAVVHTLVLRQNMAEVEAIPGFARKLGAVFEGLYFPRVEGESRLPPVEWMPRLSTIPPRVRRRIDGLLIPCAGVGRGPQEDRGVEWKEVAGRRSEAVKRSMIMFKPARCSRCAARARCTGVYKGYIELYGDGEFLPVGSA